MRYKTVSLLGDVESPDNYYKDNEDDEFFKRNLDTYLKDLKHHITKEELLCLSLYKNSKKQNNTIHQVFLKKYFNKDLKSPAITLRKQRIFKLLVCLSKFDLFKKENAIDGLLRSALTNRQYRILMMYEQRKNNDEISRITGTHYRAIIGVVRRAQDRLMTSNNPKLLKYVELLNELFRFSKKKIVRGSRKKDTAFKK